MALSRKEQMLARTLVADGHSPKEAADMLGQNYKSVMAALEEPQNIAWLSHRKQELFESVISTSSYAANYAMVQLMGAMEHAEPASKPPIAEKILKYALELRKLEARHSGPCVSAERVAERVVYDTQQPLPKPAEMTEEERERIIRQTAYEDECPEE